MRLCPIAVGHTLWVGREQLLTYIKLVIHPLYAFSNKLPAISHLQYLSVKVTTLNTKNHCSYDLVRFLQCLFYDSIHANYRQSKQYVSYHGFLACRQGCHQNHQTGWFLFSSPTTLNARIAVTPSKRVQSAPAVKPRIKLWSTRLKAELQ